LIGIEITAACGPKDSLRNKFDLNDPRNPDCPCHSQQTKADKEFKKVKRDEKADLTVKVKLTREEVYKQKHLINYSKKSSFFLKRSKHQKNYCRRRNRAFSLKGWFQKDIAGCPRL